MARLGQSLGHVSGWRPPYHVFLSDPHQSAGEKGAGGATGEQFRLLLIPYLVSQSGWVVVGFG